MAVSEQTPYIEYTANGITTSFALEFDCSSADHLVVLIDDVEPVVGSWSLTSGAVVFNTAPENGKKITIQRNTPFSRNIDYQSYNNSFRPQSVNGDFDRLWLKLQELGVGDWLLKIYVDRLHQQQEQKIDDLKNYVDLKDDELRAYLMEEIRKQGVALDQLDDYYNYLMQRLAQIAVDRGWSASFVSDASGATQQDINDQVGTKWRNKVGGYLLNDRVMLENGDIVQSTVADNTANPNVDMTGWVSANIFNTTALSVDELRQLKPIKKGQKVFLDSHILGNDSLGGGDFIATQKAGLVDNNGTVFSSPDPLLFWVRHDQTSPKPEWWGATGKDNGVDATAAVRAAIAYGQTNKKTAVCDNEYILSEQITSGVFQGITSTNRGTFHINADITPFKFSGISASKWFERMTFKYKVSATNIKPTILFDFQFLVLGMKIRDLEFWGDVGKTWVSVGIKGVNNYGFSGGFAFEGNRSHNMHANLHFIDGGTFYCNGGLISNNFDYYNNYGMLIDEGANVNNLIIQNYQAQQNTQYTICSNGRLGKSIIDLSYNWDTVRPAVFLSEFCNGVTIRETYMHDIIDLGYKTIIQQKNIDVLTDTAIAQSLVVRDGGYTEASLSNVLKIVKTGNVQVADGTHSEFTTGNNRDGYTIYTTPATTEPATQAGQLTMFNPTVQITGLASRLAGYHQYTHLRFSVNFEILTATLDDDAFIFGVGHAASNLIPSTLWVGITVRSGRIKIISKTTATTESVIADLGVVSKRRLDVQILLKSRDNTNKQPIHVNGIVVGYYDANPASNKSPFISIKSVTNPTGIHLISIGVRNTVAAGHGPILIT